MSEHTTGTRVWEGLRAKIEALPFDGRQIGSTPISKQAVLALLDEADAIPNREAGALCDSDHPIFAGACIRESGHPGQHWTKTGEAWGNDDLLARAYRKGAAATHATRNRVDLWEHERAIRHLLNHYYGPAPYAPDDDIAVAKLSEVMEVE